MKPSSANMRSVKFSERVQERMRTLGLNQEALAGRVGTSQATVSRWLSGSIPQRRTAHILAAALCVRIEWLLSGEDPMEDVATQMKKFEAAGVPLDMAAVFAEGVQGAAAKMTPEQLMEGICEQADCLLRERRNYMRPALAKIIIDFTEELARRAVMNESKPKEKDEE